MIDALRWNLRLYINQEARFLRIVCERQVINCVDVAVIGGVTHRHRCCVAIVVVVVAYSLSLVSRRRG